jgi:hypothetical protein
VNGCDSENIWSGSAYGGCNNSNSPYAFPYTYPWDCSPESAWTPTSTPAGQGANPNAACTAPTLADNGKLYQAWLEALQDRVIHVDGATNFTTQINFENGAQSQELDFIPLTVGAGGLGCLIAVDSHTCQTPGPGGFYGDWVSTDLYDGINSTGTAGGNTPIGPTFTLFYCYFDGAGTGDCNGKPGNLNLQIPLGIAEFGTTNADVNNPANGAGCNQIPYVKGPTTQYIDTMSLLTLLQNGSYPYFNELAPFDSWSKWSTNAYLASPVPTGGNKICEADWNLDSYGGLSAIYTIGGSGNAQLMAAGTPAPTYTAWPSPPPTPTPVPT